MKTIVFGAAIAGAALLSCGQAQAATVVQCASGPGECQINVNDSTTAVQFSGSISNGQVSVASFTDVYTFNLGDGVASFSLTSASTGDANDIDFSSIQLSGPGGLVDVPKLIGDPSELFQLSNFAVTSGLYTLTLVGAAGTPAAFLGGSYSSSLSFTPSLSPAVPEPATWALLVGGFGIVGASLRRNRRMKAVTA